MDLHRDPFDAGKEEDKKILSSNWWCSPLQAASWSYDVPLGEKSCKSKPPYYHEALYCTSLAGQSQRPLAPSSSPTEEANLLLNQDLPGVLAVNDVLAAYEADVGFHYCSEILDVGSTREDRCDLSTEVSEDEVAYGKQSWDELMEKLFNEVTDLREDYEGFPEGDSRSDGSSNSYISVNSSSVPSTPKAKNTEVDVEVANTSPSSSIYYSVASSPTRPLNASASSFVPSFVKPPTEPIPFPSLPYSNTPPPLTGFKNFTFPSVDVPPLPSVKIKKDEQGFYSEVETPSPAPLPRPSSALLPPFLQERRKAPVSKTRAMVERLRSSNQLQDVFGLGIKESIGPLSASHSPTPSPPMYNLTFLKEHLGASEDGRCHNSGVSSPTTTMDEDDEGWINVVEEHSMQELKAKRTRELFLALTRRRSDSMPPSKPSAIEDNSNNTTEVIIPAAYSSSPSPSPFSRSNDGWIEGSAPVTKPAGRSRAGRKRRSSNIPAPLPITPQLVLPTNVRSPGAAQLAYSPASYFYAAYPNMMSPMSYASYMQMQFQMHQMQIRRHEARTPSGEWFQYPNPIQSGVPFQKSYMNPNSGPLSAMGAGPQW